MEGCMTTGYLSYAELDPLPPSGPVKVSDALSTSLSGPPQHKVDFFRKTFPIFAPCTSPLMTLIIFVISSLASALESKIH
jgi:hypothetical protein